MARRINPDVLDLYDRIIYQTLRNSRVPLTVGRIAKWNNIQWDTVDKHLEKLHLLGHVTIVKIKRMKDNREIKYWWIALQK